MADPPKPATTMNIIIVDPNKIIYEGIIKKIFVPGRMQELAILPNHTPLYSELVEGTVKIEDEKGKTKDIKIDGGILRIKNNNLKILIGF